MALVLAPYSAEPVDLGRVVEMLLVHDLVEIDAGDTFVYDTERARRRRKSSSSRAADRLFAIVPGDDGARLRAPLGRVRGARPRPKRGSRTAIDRLAPLLLNHANHGELWQEYGITADRVLDDERPDRRRLTRPVGARRRRRARRRDRRTAGSPSSVTVELVVCGALSGISNSGWRISSTWMLSGSLK